MIEADTDRGGWQRLHPLSPVARSGRGLIALLVVFTGSLSRGSHSGNSFYIYDFAILGFVVVAGVIHWLVTRWKLDGVTLRIETGLLRRDSRQLPLARIQAVDVLRPFLARILGLAELRVRLAGSGSRDGRLAYLAEPVAIELRARLLAGHHGLDLSTPEPAELPIASVPTGRIVGAALLTPAALVTLLVIVAIIALAQVSTAAVAAIAGSSFVYLLVLVQMTWRRVNDQYGFSVGTAADGIRIRRGLLGTIAETIPLQRVQAVRFIQPLMWRPVRWSRLEVDIAGSPGREQGTRSASVTKSLLPVGPREMASELLHVLLGISGPTLSPPPRRAFWKTPLRYHFLGAAHDERLASASTGRIRKVTTWVPLEKVQSIRRVEGPIQRMLKLATICADAAGKRVTVELRDRDVNEADRLLEDLTILSRAARRRASNEQPSVGGISTSRSAPLPTTSSQNREIRRASPPGWYPDPSGRHELRYWNGAAWTEYVSNGGSMTSDPT